MMPVGTILKLLACAALVGLGVIMGHAWGDSEGYARGEKVGTDKATALYAGKLDQMTQQAAHDLAEATAHNATLKQDYNDLEAAWKVDHADAQTKLKALTDRNRSLLSAAGRLRDPNLTASTCRDSGQSATATAGAGPASGAGSDAAAGGDLSADLSRLLLEQAALADSRNHAVNECIAFRDAVVQRGIAQ